MYNDIVSMIVGLGIAESDITAGSHLRTDLELDSTDLVELSLEIKRRYDADVKLESVDDLTVSDVDRLVNTALAEGDARAS